MQRKDDETLMLFQPTFPQGERPRPPAGYPRKTAFQSALRGGSDCIISDNIQNVNHFNPRSRRRSDVSASSLRFVVSGISIRAPAGGATELGAAAWVQGVISIRAPARERLTAMRMCR